MGSKNSKGNSYKWNKLKPILKFEVLDFLGEKRVFLAKIKNERIINLLKDYSKFICSLNESKLILNINYVDDETAKLLGISCKNIRYLKDLKINYFEYRGRFSQGIKYIGKFIETLHNSLEYFTLNLDTLDISKDNFYSFSLSLAYLRSLKSLSLEFTLTVFQSSWLGNLLFYVCKSNNLSSFRLSIAGNRSTLDETTIDSFQSLPLTINKLEFNLNGKRINSSHLSRLSLIIKERRSLSFLSLDITENFVNDEGISNFASSLGELKLLQELKLNLSMKKSCNLGFENLTKSFKYLDLMKSLFINFGEVDLCDKNLDILGLSLKSMKYLNKLDLKFKFMKEENLSFFLTNIGDLKYLKRLNLNIDNHIKETFSLSNLNKCLKKLRSLEQLHIDFNEILINEKTFNNFIVNTSNLKKLRYLTLKLYCHHIKKENSIKILNSLNKIDCLEKKTIIINKENFD